MNRIHSQFRSLLPALFLAPWLWVAGCATAPPTGPSTGPATRAETAARWYQQGRFAEAESLYAQLAETDPERRDSHLLWAADAAWLGSATGRSEAYLWRVDPERLNSRERDLAGLLALLQGRVDAPSPRARLQLLSARDESWPDPHRPALHRLRAAAYLESGNPYLGAVERIALGAWLLDAEQARRNRTEILQTLSELSARQATELMRGHRTDEEIYGWLALVAQIKDELSAGGSLGEAIASWRSRFPGHPAAADPLEARFLGRRPVAELPLRIALLLPTSGRMVEPAAALRSGFVAAYLNDPERRAEVRFYDTGSTPADALYQYHRAIADGAEQIVGPLDRDAVAAVLREADGTVPVLALNYQQSEAPVAAGNLQLGLLPEDEAEAAAQRMLRDGVLRASVVVPDNEFGLRLADAFVADYRRLGGVVYEIQRYAEEQPEIGAMIRRVVGVTESELRERALARTLGRPLSFEAQPRQDLDGLFLVGRPAHGRLIKPQLAFFNAGRLPVYSTSRIYEGREDSNADRDLDGIVFCDIPFLLNGEDFEPSLSAARKAFPEILGVGARLFAVGADAYRLIPYLDWLAGMGGETFPGATGRLRMDSSGRFHRSLDCGRFERGRVVYEPAKSLAAE